MDQEDDDARELREALKRAGLPQGLTHELLDELDRDFKSPAAAWHDAFESLKKQTN
jgi:hypothetical protein